MDSDPDGPEPDGPTAADGSQDAPHDADYGDPPGTHTALPPKLEAWRRRSAAGAILTGFALGLQEALEKRKEEPSIVMETSGDPPQDLPVEADFEYGRPRQSVVHIRPWLLRDSADDDDGHDGHVDSGDESHADSHDESHDESDGDPDARADPAEGPESDGGRDG